MAGLLLVMLCVCVVASCAVMGPVMCCVVGCVISFVGCVMCAIADGGLHFCVDLTLY